MAGAENIDPKVVDDFGAEWAAFDQSAIDEDGLRAAFDQYFHIFPFADLKPDAEGFDMGCGSGRWAQLAAPQVGVLNCIEPSPKALSVARKKLKQQDNARFHHAGVADAPLEPASQDFGYCLGVLHHIPNTADGIKDCAKLLKSGAPFLLYLYYSFENRPFWFRMLWRLSDVFRRAISRLPFGPKKLITSLIALFVYWPLARLALVLEKMGFSVTNAPLVDYRDKSFYFMRTDALDRFGTKLEQRFSRAEITKMLTDAGFERITFSERQPLWVSLSYKR